MDVRHADPVVRWLPPLLGLAAVAILLFATLPYGIGITSDCVDFFSTAANLVHGAGFIQHDGRPYASWPPLYPVLLAVGSRLSAGPETTALFINMLSVFLTIWLVSRWLHRHLRSTFLAHWASLVLLLHFALLDVALHAWTEPLFNLMAIVFILRLPDVSREDRWRPLIALSLLASAAWLLRYVGVTLVALGGLFLLFSGGVPWRRRLARATAFGFIATLPAALWLLRNFVVMRQMAGERSPSAFSLPLNLRRLLKAGWWILPESWGNALPALFFLAFAAGLAGLAIVLRGRTREKILRRALLGFSALYLSMLIYTSTRYAFEAIHSRYLIPIFIPMLIWMALVLDAIFVSLRKHSGRILMAIILALWLFFPAAQSVKLIAKARIEGMDVFGAPVWRNWVLWDWLKGSPKEAILISNGADAVYYLTGLPVRLAPRKWMHSAGRTPTSELEDFEAIFEENRPVLYVWIMNFPRTGARVNYYSPEEILERYRLEPIVAFPEGAVFMVLPR